MKIVVWIASLKLHSFLKLVSVLINLTMWLFAVGKQSQTFGIATHSEQSHSRYPPTSSYFKAAVLPVKYSIPATLETFGLYPLLGIPKTVQRAEPIRSKLSTHPVPPRRASGSFRPCARAVRNTDSADSLNLHWRCSRNFSNRFCNENMITPVHLPELCTMI